MGHSPHGAAVRPCASACRDVPRAFSDRLCRSRNARLLRGRSFDLDRLNVSGIASGAEDARAVAAGEVRGCIRASSAAGPGKRAVPGESLPAPVTVPPGPGDISVFSPQALNGGPPDGAILYLSQEPPKTAPRQQPQTRPQPAAQPGCAPVAAAAGAAGTGAALGRPGKLAAPACGPAVILCAFAFWLRTAGCVLFRLCAEEHVQAGAGNRIPGHGTLSPVPRAGPGRSRPGAAWLA